MKKMVMAAVLAAAVVGAASAQDKKESALTIRVGGALSSGYFVTGSSIGFGANVKSDFSLKNLIKIPLFVGADVGLDIASYKPSGAGKDLSLWTFPLAARVGFDFSQYFLPDSMDLWIVGSIGFGLAVLTGMTGRGDENLEGGGLVYGGNIGFAYYFIPSIGAFVEGGYLYTTGKVSKDVEGLKLELAAFSARYVTLGVTFRW